MINYSSGYYITLTIFNENRFKDELLGVSAYLFTRDGTYKVASKQEFLKYITDFEKEELLHGNNVEGGTFEITDNRFFVLKPSNVFGNNIEILNSNKLYNSSTKAYMYFIPWSRYNVLYEEGKVNGKKIIDEVLKIQKH